MGTTTRSEEVLVPYNSAHFNVTVCLSQKYRAKIPSEDKLKARGSQLLYMFLIAVRLVQQRQPRAGSCLLLVPAGTESWFPGDVPHPQAGPGAGLLLPSPLWKKDQEPKPRAPVCLPVAKLEASSQAWLVPGGREISPALCLPVCRTSWEPPGWSQPLPAGQAWEPPSSLPSATRNGGSRLLGAVKSRLLRRLGSGSWIRPCQQGTAALLAWGNTARVKFPLSGKEAGKSESRVGWPRARKIPEVPEWRKDKDMWKNGPKGVKGTGVLPHRPKSWCYPQGWLVLKHGGCSYCETHEESRDDTENLLPSLNTVRSFIFKNTAPTDSRESVVKEKIRFNLQTERLTPVNLKFLKFRTSSPNIPWEFSSSNVRRWPHDSIVHSWLQAPSQSAWISFASIIQEQNFTLRETGRKASQFRVRSCPSVQCLLFRTLPTDTAWGTLPHIIEDHPSKVPAFCQTSFPTLWEGNQQDEDRLHCPQTRGKEGCFFLVVTTLLFWRNEDIPRTALVPVSCTEIRCSSSSSFSPIPPPGLPQSKTLILSGWD